jgi:hypothetical protein
MPATRDPMGVPAAAAALLARAASAGGRDRSRLRHAIDDLFLPDDARLDERTRAGFSALMHSLIATVEGEVGAHAARLLAARGEAALGERLATPEPAIADRLIASGLLRDAELVGELLDRVQESQIGAALPVTAPAHPDRPSLAARLARSSDRVVASGALALIIAAGSRSGHDAGPPTRTDLPAELHHRLVWWVAAALRGRVAAGDTIEALDRALAEAAQRSLAAHDEGERLEAVASRLAAAIDARPDELGALLQESLSDRNLPLFTALFARALGVDYATARTVVLDPAGERLALGLRAIGVERATLAQIALLLAEADPRRSEEALPDFVDAASALSPEEARTRLAPLRLHPHYRAALLALDERSP